MKLHDQSGVESSWYKIVINIISKPVKFPKMGPEEIVFICRIKVLAKWENMENIWRKLTKASFPSPCNPRGLSTKGLTEGLFAVHN